MLATELIARLRDQVQEFGDHRVVTPDQMEPKWILDFTDVEYEDDREVLVLIPENLG